jgi:para-aminobenzoate synthetase/4-amino-4-deoxychorismate lyase
MLKAEVLTHVRPPFSLLETMHWSPDGVTRRSRHLVRLSTSADFFGYPLDLKQVEKALDGISGDTEQAVRLSLAADGEIGLECGPLPESTGFVRLAVDTETVDPKDIFLYHKTTNRRLYQDSAARFPEADEVVLVNPDGNVTETTISNLAARFGTVWLTPPVTDGCLPGAHRSELVSQGKLREASISVERLLSADEIAVLNSLRGWRSASVLIPSPLRR